jgi:flagellar basal-body rod modification protein FlgD
MATAGITTYNRATVDTTVKTGAYNTLVNDKNQMDQSDYLQLMMAQMQNQDPMEPQGTQEMMAQMTQLSSTQALSELTTTMKGTAAMQNITNAASMIGKAVYGKDSTGADLEGSVKSAVVRDSVTYLDIDDGSSSGALMKLSDVLMVQDKSILSSLVS